MCTKMKQLRVPKPSVKILTERTGTCNSLPRFLLRNSATIEEATKINIACVDTTVGQATVVTCDAATTKTSSASSYTGSMPSISST